MINNNNQFSTFLVFIQKRVPSLSSNSMVFSPTKQHTSNEKIIEIYKQNQKKSNQLRSQHINFEKKFCFLYHHWSNQKNTLFHSPTFSPAKHQKSTNPTKKKNIHLNGSPEIGKLKTKLQRRRHNFFLELKLFRQHHYTINVTKNPSFVLLLLWLSFKIHFYDSLSFEKQNFLRSYK